MAIIKQITNSQKRPTPELLEMNVLLKQKRLTGFSGGGAVAAAVEGISFPLEREEAVET
jgi:hypothetical protein